MAARENREEKSGYENLAEKSARTPGSAANLAVYMKGINMPCSRQDLMRHAQQQGAPQEVQNIINNLPERTYNSMADVEKEFGKIR